MTKTSTTTGGKIVKREFFGNGYKITIKMDTTSKGKVLKRETLKDGSKRISIQMG